MLHVIHRRNLRYRGDTRVSNSADIRPDHNAQCAEKGEGSCTRMPTISLAEKLFVSFLFFIFYLPWKECEIDTLFYYPPLP